jgi:hypothetical protein
LANGAQIWQNSTVIWQNLLHFQSEKNVGDTERQIFRQMLIAGNFSLVEQSLVKSTPGVNFTNV